MTEIERLKQRVAIAAAVRVRSGMLVGLGTGSTASHLVRELGRRLANGELRDVRGVPTAWTRSTTGSTASRASAAR